MRIALVQPGMGTTDGGPEREEGRMEPLSLGVLAALTPPPVECVLWDDRVEAIPFEEPCDLAAISVEIYTARRAYEIADRFRARGVPVVLGGMHPSLAPDEALAHADAVFVGDAESGWARVAHDVAARKLTGRIPGGPGPAQPGGLRPRRDLFAGKGYLPVALVQWSRGCRFSCRFCAASSYFGHRHYVRPTAEVLDEIRSLDGRTVFFVDDNFVSDREAAKRFLRELVPLRVRWVSQGSVDMADDPELMDLVEESGGQGFVVGFESIRTESLKDCAKSPNLRGAALDRYDRACASFRAHGLQTWAAFTLGHDHDTVESILDTLRWAIERKFAFAAFNLLMPYPGTPLYEALSRERRLLYGGAWWLDPAYRLDHATFVPRRMSADELTEVTQECRRRWSAPSSILRRALDPRTNLSSPRKLARFLAYSALFRREVRRKRESTLGSGPDRDSR